MLTGPSSAVSPSLLWAVLVLGRTGDDCSEGACDDPVFNGIVYASLVMVMSGAVFDVDMEGRRCRSCMPRDHPCRVEKV